MSTNFGQPFDDLRAALAESAAGGEDPAAESTVRLDPGRVTRSGVPEVVHAEHKSPTIVAAALRRLADANGRALASRCRPESAEAIVAELAATHEVSWRETARAIVIAQPGVDIVPSGGRVAVISAGTSDVPVAAEAALMAREMGAAVEEVWDVGVAGLHRLVRPLERMMGSGVDVLIVAAGMDGALPSVVAGLVSVPVIGLPTAVGYGFGGGGIGAMTTMLQSCAPGLVVVNVDNGIGAGATAALIANRVAAARNAPAQPAVDRRDERGGDHPRR